MEAQSALQEPEARGQTLDGFIIKPYQRIARYPMLLRVCASYCHATGSFGGAC